MKITKQFTNRESKSLDQYLQEIGKVDLLIPEEEIELAIRIKKGDEVAKEKLVKAKIVYSNILDEIKKNPESLISYF